MFHAVEVEPGGDYKPMGMTKERQTLGPFWEDVRDLGRRGNTLMVGD